MYGSNFRSYDNKISTYAAIENIPVALNPSSELLTVLMPFSLSRKAKYCLDGVAHHVDDFMTGNLEVYKYKSTQPQEHKNDGI